ncbi:12184_t:CDS:1 [Dentiscutata erythropus]|uniref:12184_t:CDS:1 n=1 Tax=Dentiscutata erythropus TaxID=1348616 RepID=A0A9N9I7W8_9GLOM|nr:12184_t:CDS:1 [Dentiscutata erythropus]
MKFFKKLLKLFKKNKKQEDSWDDICVKVESWSTSSTSDKEDSFETTLLLVEFDNQFSVIDLKFYTRYEEYLDDVRQKKPKNYKKFKIYFSFLDAHIRSYHNLFYDGMWYYRDSWNLLLHRRKGYENDFEFAIDVLNKNFSHIYLLDYNDLLDYAKNNLIF